MKIFQTKYFLLVCLLFECVTVFGQGSFQKRLSAANFREIKSSINNYSGGGVIVGTAMDIPSGLDVLLVNFDSQGDTVWVKSYNISGSDYPSKIVKTSDFGYLIVGTTNTGTYGLEDIFVLKVDSSGNPIFQRTYNLIFIEEGTGICSTNDSCFLIVGTSRKNFFTDTDITFLKIDNFGNLIWSKLIGTQYSERAVSISKAGDGNFLIGGSTDSPRIGNNRENSEFLKVNQNGDILWNKNVGTIFSEETNVIISDSLNNIFLCGNISDSLLNQSILLVKTDSIGTFQWGMKYNHPNWSGVSNIYLNDTNIYISGYITQVNTNLRRPLLLKLDQNGSIIMTRTIPENGANNFLRINLDNSITMFSLAIDTLANPSIFISKSDVNGAFPCFSDTVNFLETPQQVIVEDDSLFKNNVNYSDSNNVFLSIPQFCFPSPICLSNNIEKLNDLNFKIFPNPTNNFLQIYFEGDDKEIESSNVSIFNQLGSKIQFETSMEGKNSIQLNLKSLAPGVYFLQIVSPNYLTTRKIIVQH